MLCSCGEKLICERNATTSQMTRWISYKDEKCTNIQRIEPPQTPVGSTNKAMFYPQFLQVSRSENLHLKVQNLPIILNTDYKCVFQFANGDTVSSPARKVADDTLNCHSHDRSSLPSMEEGQHALNATLSIQTEDGVEFASKEFAFYDCVTYTTCR